MRARKLPRQDIDEFEVTPFNPSRLLPDCVPDSPATANCRMLRFELLEFVRGAFF